MPSEMGEGGRGVEEYFMLCRLAANNWSVWQD